MMMADIVFNSNAKPGKRFKLSNYCLSCSDPIPPDKNFCCDECENAFYDESALEREEDEALLELEMMEREERRCKSIP